MYNVRIIYLSWNLQASGLVNTKLNYKKLVMFTSNTLTRNRRMTTIPPHVVIHRFMGLYNNI